jgi:hypothetical protein
MKRILDFDMFNLLESLIKSEMQKEVDIIYQDPNLICMIPKTQRASKIYGGGTNWCQTGKDGFETWAHGAFLVRFLFKGGRKIRFTLDTSGEFHWASERGHHVLKGHGDPFDVMPSAGSIIENDIVSLIKEIPEECKKKVRALIACRELPDYTLDLPLYTTARTSEVNRIMETLRRKYSQRITDAYLPLGFTLGFATYDKKGRTISIVYSVADEDGNVNTFKEAFPRENISDIEKRVEQILDYRDRTGGSDIPSIPQTMWA